MLLCSLGLAGDSIVLDNKIWHFRWDSHCPRRTPDTTLPLLLGAIVVIARYITVYLSDVDVDSMLLEKRCKSF
jgi:hypothetical protein